MSEVDRISERAGEALPEERDSADPRGQAEAVLADSDERQGDRDEAPDAVVEHRRSADTVEP